MLILQHLTDETAPDLQGWFPSLVCKNYIFKHSVKTVEATFLKFCTTLKLVTLHLGHTIVQVKHANYASKISNAHVQTFVLLNGEKAIVSES